jgi:hypothetical protein
VARGRLFTEACVRALAPGSELVLAPGDVVTPAALDRAFERRIRVLRPGEGGAAPARAASGAGGAPALWARMLAHDGSYVVEVRGGRASVFRLGPDGPQALRDEGGA